MQLSSSIVSVHQQIASRLRSDVRRGVYAPGDPLRETQLAAQFGVSRSPIRQVLQQLTFEGLLQAKPNCGTVVAQRPTAEVMQALRECRVNLEVIALQHCFQELDEDDFHRWRKILGELYLACDRSDHIVAYELDNQFHRLVIDKAEQTGAAGVYAVIAAATSEYMSVSENRPFHADFRELYAMHAALYAIYRMGDLELACEALRQHILFEPFVADCCRCWTEAGKPSEVDSVYDHLADSLREAARQRQNQTNGSKEKA